MSKKNKHLKILQVPKARELARSAIGVTGLIELGRSYVLVLPRVWIELNCDLVENQDGKPIPWVKLIPNTDDTITVIPLTRDELAKEIDVITPITSKKVKVSS